MIQGNRRGGAFSAFQRVVKSTDEIVESSPTVRKPTLSQNLLPTKAAAPKAPRPWRRAALNPKTLSLEETKLLLETLRGNSRRDDFQKALKNLRDRGWGAFKKREAVARLLALAWKEALKSSGFSIDEYGFPQMLAAVRLHSSQPGIRTISEEVERQLKFPPGSLFGAKAGSIKGSMPQPTPSSELKEDVAVLVQHPIDHTEITVKVPADASIRQVKFAISRHLGKDEVMTSGRIVTMGSTGEMVPVPDSQKLGTRRSILLIGVSLNKAKPEATEKPAKPAAKPTRDRPMNLGEAKEMLKEFRDISMSKDVQKMLAQMHKQGEQVVQRQQPAYISQIWSRTMTKFDFPITEEGFQDMMRGIAKHGWNLHVRTVAHEVERTLRMPLGTYFGIPPCEGEEDAVAAAAMPKLGAPVPPSKDMPTPQQRPREDIEVQVRHAVEGTAVTVRVPKNATFMDVKEALVEVVGSPDIPMKGRLVKQKGGIYSSYKDTDPLLDVRQVLILGASLKSEESSSSSSSGDEADGAPKVGNLRVQPKQPTSQFASAAAAKKSAHEPTSIGKPQALSLQKELLNGFKDSEFQKKLHNLEKEHGRGTRKFIAERSKLFLSVQSKVLPKYGFEESHRGVYDMIGALSVLKQDPEIEALSKQINVVLGLDENSRSGKHSESSAPSSANVAATIQSPASAPTSVAAAAVAATASARDVFKPMQSEHHKAVPISSTGVDVAPQSAKLHDTVQRPGFAWKTKVQATVDKKTESEDTHMQAPKPTAALESKAKAKPKPCPPPSKEMSLTVVHALENSELAVLSTFTDWTFVQIRAALAKSVGSDDVIKKARFVYKQNTRAGAWVPFKEDEYVGCRDTVHVLGIDPQKCPITKAKDVTTNKQEVHSKMSELRQPPEPEIEIQKMAHAPVKAAVPKVSSALSSKATGKESPIVKSQPATSARSVAARTHRKSPSPDLQGQLQKEQDDVSPPSAVDTTVMPGPPENTENSDPTIVRVGALLEQLKRMCLTPEFETKLMQLRAKHLSRPAILAATGVLFAVSSRQTAIEFGFGGDQQGYKKMMQIICANREHSSIASRMDLIEGQLQVPSGTCFHKDNSGARVNGQDNNQNQKQQEDMCSSQTPTICFSAKQHAREGPMTLKEAQDLLERVCDLCTTRAVQDDIAKLQVAGHRDRELQARLGSVFASTCRNIAKEFGFGGSFEGFTQMLVAIAMHRGEPLIANLAHQIEETICLPIGTWFKLCTSMLESDKQNSVPTQCI